MSDRIGAGGFGQVFVVTSGEEEAVAKFVPKAPGADRELLFVSFSGARNVVPVIDSGDHGNSWVLVMPRADLSLRNYLDHDAALSIEECGAILADVAAGLSDLDGRVVHRDLKPENLLRLNGHWWTGSPQPATAMKSKHKVSHARTAAIQLCMKASIQHGWRPPPESESSLYPTHGGPFRLIIFARLGRTVLAIRPSRTT